MLKFFTFLILSSAIFYNPIFAKDINKKWKEKDCLDLYNAIILFTKLSDKEWKNKIEKKGAFYAAVAADYTIIFNTFCTK